MSTPGPKNFGDAQRRSPAHEGVADPIETRHSHTLSRQNWSLYRSNRLGVKYKVPKILGYAGPLGMGRCLPLETRYSPTFVISPSLVALG